MSNQVTTLGLDVRKLITQKNGAASPEGIRPTLGESILLQESGKANYYTVALTLLARLGCVTIFVDNLEWEIDFSG